MSNNRDNTLATSASIVDSILDNHYGLISNEDLAIVSELKILIRDIQIEQLKTGKISEKLLNNLFNSLVKVEDVIIYSDSGAYQLQKLNESLSDWLSPYVEIKSLHNDLSDWLKLLDKYTDRKVKGNDDHLSATKEFKAVSKATAYITRALRAIEANDEETWTDELRQLNIKLKNNIHVVGQPALTANTFDKNDLTHYIRLAYQVSEPYADAAKDVEEARVDHFISLLRSLPSETKVNVMCARTYIDTKARLFNMSTKLKENYVEYLCNQAMQKVREDVSKLKKSIINEYAKLHTFVFDLDTNTEISIMSKDIVKYIPRSGITTSDLAVLTRVLREQGITLSNSYMNPNLKHGFIQTVEKMFNTTASSQPVAVTYPTQSRRFTL